MFITCWFFLFGSAILFFLGLLLWSLFGHEFIRKLNTPYRIVEKKSDDKIEFEIQQRIFKKFWIATMWGGFGRNAKTPDELEKQYLKLKAGPNKSIKILKVVDVVVTTEYKVKDKDKDNGQVDKY